MLLVVVAAFPKGAQPVVPTEDLILAHGEVTGHAHRIKEFTKVRVWNAGAERFIQAVDSTQLTHEEHHAATLEAGVIYKQFHQVEDFGEVIQPVRD